MAKKAKHFWTRAKITWSIVLGVVIVGLGVFSYLYIFTNVLTFFAETPGTNVEPFSSYISASSLTAQHSKTIRVSAYVLKQNFGAYPDGVMANLTFSTTAACSKATTVQGVNPYSRKIFGVGYTVAGSATITRNKAEWDVASTKECVLNNLTATVGKTQGTAAAEFTINTGILGKPVKLTFTTVKQPVKKTVIVQQLPPAAAGQVDLSKTITRYERVFRSANDACTIMRVYFKDGNGNPVKGAVSVHIEGKMFTPDCFTTNSSTFTWGVTGAKSDAAGVAVVSLGNIDGLPADQIMSVKLGLAATLSTTGLVESASAASPAANKLMKMRMDKVRSYAGKDTSGKDTCGQSQNPQAVNYGGYNVKAGSVTSLTAVGSKNTSLKVTAIDPKTGAERKVLYDEKQYSHGTGQAVVSYTIPFDAYNTNGTVIHFESEADAEVSLLYSSGDDPAKLFVVKTIIGDKVSANIYFVSKDGKTFGNKLTPGVTEVVVGPGMFQAPPSCEVVAPSDAPAPSQIVGSYEVQNNAVVSAPKEVSGPSEVNKNVWNDIVQNLPED